MIVHFIQAAAVMLALCGSAAVVSAEEGESLIIAYLGIRDDPRHRQQETYTNLVLRPAIDPFQGAETALREMRILGRALKLNFALERAHADDAEGLAAAIDRLQTERSVRFFVLDAADEVVAEVARRTRRRDILLFNISARDDTLRNQACQPHLMHVVPSRSMLTDALAQHAVARGWRDILVLYGPEPADAALAGAFERSAKKFGARIAEKRAFLPTNDPRQREQNNVALLTGGVEYDLIFIADTVGDFARLVPYQTARPRPIMGSEGLQAAAWHWAFERHGAPQLNQRFNRIAGRRMTDSDWAAWAALRVITEAVVQTGSAAFGPAAGYLKSGALTLDNYKGSPGSFRPWDNQLRQPILLHTHNAVVERTPLPGFLHASHNLDTLGSDRAETGCRF